VRINDRFPNHKGRVIDVSKAAAQAIGLIGPGTGRVRLEVLP
jgi:rare lipoprotein A